MTISRPFFLQIEMQLTDAKRALPVKESCRVNIKNNLSEMSKVRKEGLDRIFFSWMLTERKKSDD